MVADKAIMQILESLVLKNHCGSEKIRTLPVMHNNLKVDIIFMLRYVGIIAQCINNIYVLVSCLNLLQRPLRIEKFIVSVCAYTLWQLLEFRCSYWVDNQRIEMLWCYTMLCNIKQQQSSKVGNTILLGMLLATWKGVSW